MWTSTERGTNVRRRLGFTMLELLMVVGIISILIALLLPAIQSSREQARRVQCSNHLMQIGLAVGNYHASNRVFPPGVVNPTGPISSKHAGYHWGWQARILPFLEYTNLYNQINFTESVYAGSNETSQGHGINIFLCPSDGIRGLSSYAGCHHDVEAPIEADNHGLLYLNSRIAYDDIDDGPAYTIMAGEFVQTSFTLGWAVGTRSTLRNTGSPINAPSAQSWTPRPGAIVSQATIQPDGLDELKQMIDDGTIDTMYVGGFSSRHPGGANFLLADGSIRFLTERLSPSIYQSLGHRADGNLISSDEY